ncbi:phosphate acetyltransferase [Truepera radiovictrix]|uniref:Phosphate acetyltransferase n=1 Tax=Truepera radiovictrix (strain DSM 17093 / CIP 108686 / LMG 22925 / RQ-24) TaxID=649638 RepID=D7CQP9_TRURR|nr:phosphate acetyltransferase [Truepera radiovictrix]ADI15033.1 phosphate acetyltransferase [Truepera radiovictrix DSM 17093]WMT56414.1 phosphate acetyltransferase [Truepera radiovictrix]
MAQAILVVPTGQRVGLTSVAVGLVHALDRRGVRVGFCKPVAQMSARASGRAPEPERSSRLVERVAGFSPPEPVPASVAEERFAHAQREVLLEEVVARFEAAASRADVVVVEGLVATPEQPYAGALNAGIARSLDAKVLLVAAPGSSTPAELSDTLELAAQDFGGTEGGRVIGCILNQVGAPPEAHTFMRLGSEPQRDPGAFEAQLRAEAPVLKGEGFRLYGAVPWDRDLLAPRVRDVQAFLGAEVLREGDLGRRVTEVALGASTMLNAAKRLLPGTLFITSGDRDDLVMAAAMAALSGRPIAALLLTNGRRPSDDLLALCAQGFATGLPLLLVADDSFGAALRVRGMDLEIPLDDTERIARLVEHVAAHLDVEALERRTRGAAEGRRLSPPAFRYLLVERARAANKRIILPEGDEPRTLRAATICLERKIARCVLLGDPDEIHAVAARHGLTLPEGLEILRPEEHIGRFIEPLVALRKHKGMNAPMAEEALQDNVVLGTMMLQQGEVDGLVSGAVHTTANTIRPALQLIKTAPGVRVVSSVFFMCLPEQVLVYGDCAINPNPTAEELADIALQSADSAAAFGIPPRVAMLSYSTGTSGAGSDVEKVREATRIAQARRPDLLIDGPLQYDAAAIETVARSKAPGSKVAGRATVFIFPDLNTGNTTYKAVQRSADVISIGPMLQGLKKPVNDLSRGALVDDIVFTIALTAIQAKQAEQAAQVERSA